MKLVEILAREVDVWPEGASYARQDADLEVCFDSVVHGYDFMAREEAEDNIHDGVIGIFRVTRAQWEAERARILAESQPERDPEVAEIVEKACGKRSKEDQELWDKVAITLYIERVKLNCPHDGDVDLFECAFSGADAFMAERARILAESQPERDPEVAEIVEKACGKRSKEDQELWDDIAKAHFKKVCTEEYSRFQFFAEIAFDAADEFMTERAKRMK